MSNRDRSAGSSYLAEVRTIETLERGAPEAPVMGFGERVRIEMLDKAGASIFGAIEPKVAAAAALNAGFSADHVRFHGDFVCFTPRNRPSWWCPRSSGFDPNRSFNNRP